MPPFRWALVLAGLAAGWLLLLYGLYDGSPTALAWTRLGLPFLLSVAAGWAWAAARKPRDLPWAAVPVLLAAVLGPAAWGAEALRARHAVSAADLKRIVLDRRADPGTLRPRSNFQLRRDLAHARYDVTLSGVLANDNDFPVWETELRLQFSRKGEVAWEGTLVLRQDLPARGSGPVVWGRTFSLEELPAEPEWDVTVVSARRHW